MAYLQVHLKVMKESVSQWERGLKKPGGATLKPLSLADIRELNAIT